MTGQLQVNGKLRHLRCCTLEDQSLALKYTECINMSSQQPFEYMSRIYSYSRKYPDNYPVNCDRSLKKLTLISPFTLRFNEVTV